MSETRKLFESIQNNLKEENLKESITIEDAENFAQRLDSCEDMDDVQQLINEIPDGVLENEVQSVFDQCEIDGDDLDTVKSLVSTTFEDNAEYLDESDNINKEISIDKLVNDMNNVDWNNTEIPEYLKPLIDKISRMIDANAWDDDDDRINWEKSELIKLGIKEEDLNDVDLLLNLDDYLTNLAL